MKFRVSLPAIGLALFASSCGQLSSHDAKHTSIDDTQAPSATSGAHVDDAEDESDDGDDEVEVALAAVPAAVKSAAIGAVPGLVLTKASTETEHGVLIYDLEGTANGVAYEVEVSASGQVNEIERADDDDDEH